MKEIEKLNQYDVMEKVIGDGDLSKLSSKERLQFYSQTCQSLGLNPLTQPFKYIRLNNKLTLYATKDATEQLRQIHGVSIFNMQSHLVEGVYIVTVNARDDHGREDIATGAVNIEALKGENRANAVMKAETKAKRRVTLSICGLGFLDESELESVNSASPANVNMETGEYIEVTLSKDEIDMLDQYIGQMEKASSEQTLRNIFFQVATLYQDDPSAMKQLIEVKDRCKAIITAKREVICEAV